MTGGRISVRSGPADAACAIAMMSVALVSVIAGTSCNQNASRATPPTSQPTASVPATNPTAATQPNVYDCRWTDAPITIDGKADEPAWAHAQVVDDFRIPGPVGGKPQTATKARLLWDREYLYY